jgi:hypothetical protein
VTTLDEALRPVLTPLLPVKGLRRDASGNLTEDAMKIVLEGLKSLGANVDTEAAQDAILQEARYSLCRLYAQYQVLLNQITTSISRSEDVDSKMVTASKEKLQMMMDILSIAQNVLNQRAQTMEGFRTQRVATSLREKFQDMATDLQVQKTALENKNYLSLQSRALENVTEKNNYASRQLGLYAFMNVVAVGLLFYILSI